LNLNLIIVLNTHPELEVTVEGHTDSIAIHNSFLLDNWDLSVKRSISDLGFWKNSIRLIPRMTMAARSKYIP
jgi:chemotaxis protein MotB